MNLTSRAEARHRNMWNLKTNKNAEFNRFRGAGIRDRLKDSNFQLG
jgi:hypothetical protein